MAAKVHCLIHRLSDSAPSRPSDIAGYEDGMGHDGHVIVAERLSDVIGGEQ